MSHDKSDLIPRVPLDLPKGEEIPIRKEPYPSRVVEKEPYLVPRRVPEIRCSPIPVGEKDPREEKEQTWQAELKTAINALLPGYPEDQAAQIALLKLFSSCGDFGLDWKEAKKLRKIGYWIANDLSSEMTVGIWVRRIRPALAKAFKEAAMQVLEERFPGITRELEGGGIPGEE